MRFIVLVLVAAVVQGATGVERLYRLDLLPRFHESVAVGSVSSYDRTGGNDDGFSGKYSFVGKEDGGLVIADLEGPGVIYRIWTPTPTEDETEFYFDGESEPRIRVPFRQLFTGEVAPFLEPLSGFGGGGFYSYVPIPYAKSCRIVVRAEKFRFYQINYATYPESAGIRSYPGPEDSEYEGELKRARALWAAAGSDISEHLAPTGARLESTSGAHRLGAGQPATIFEAKAPGRVVGLRISPAGALAGKGRGIVLRAYWDEEEAPAIDVPAGDLFGYAWGEPAVRSLLLGTNGDTNYLYLPMPFDNRARIELVQEDPAAAPVEIRSEVVHTEVGRRPDEGKLYVNWRRENPTEAGRPFTFLEASGRGHLVGLILQAQGLETGSTSFFEGDDQTTLDGKLAVHGTGSEDLFNGGWYNVPGRWDGRISLPVSGALDYNVPLARTGGYRFFVTDVYAFRQSIRQTIEHAPTENKLLTDYAGVTFFYAESPEFERGLPSLEDRRVRDLERIDFSPGWSVPIESFSIQNATVTKRVRKFKGKSVRYLSVRMKGEDRFGPHHVALRCDLPVGGSYRVAIEAIEGPDGATVQLSRNENLVGAAVDPSGAARVLGGPHELGVFEFEQGPNKLFFKLLEGRRFDLVGVSFEAER